MPTPRSLPRLAVAALLLQSFSSVPAYAQSGAGVTLLWDQNRQAETTRFGVFLRCGDEQEWRRVGTASQTTFTYTGVLPERVACLFSVAAVGLSGEIGPLAEPVMYLNGRSRFNEPSAIDSSASVGVVPRGASPVGMIPATADVSHLTSLSDGSLVFVDGRHVKRFGARGALETLLSLHADEGDVAGLAVDPRFDSTGFVFLCLTDRNADPRFASRVVRYRAIGGTLGEPSVIAVGIPRPVHGLVPLSVDPAGEVYVAVGRLAQGDTPYASRVLRISSDGWTVSARPGAGPVVAAGTPYPLSVTSDDDGRLWLADRQEGLVAVNQDGGRWSSVDGPNPWTSVALATGDAVRALAVDAAGGLFLARETEGRISWESIRAAIPSGWVPKLVHMTNSRRVHAVLENSDSTASGIAILHIP